VRWGERDAPAGSSGSGGRAGGRDRSRHGTGSVMGPAGPARPRGEAEGGGSPHSAGRVIRPAVQGEAEALRDVVHAAYAHYVPRIGKPPGPMLDDYALRIANGQAWVLEDAGRIIGVLVLEDQSDSLLL